MAKQTTTAAKPKFVPVDSGKSTGTVKYVKAKELAESGFKGVVAEGIFVGTTENQFNADKPNIKIESLEANEDGTPNITIINAAGNLNYRMKSVNVGDVIQVSYLGQEKMKSDNKAINGKLSHQFEVLRAED